MLPKYIINLCENNLKFAPAPYEYYIYLNKHIPHGIEALKVKVEQLEKFIQKHHGEFNIIWNQPKILDNMLAIKISFNCDIIIAKEIDNLIN
jgi:hypothetical protein